jgi:hypothetical protein
MEIWDKWLKIFSLLSIIYPSHENKCHVIVLVENFSAYLDKSLSHFWQGGNIETLGRNQPVGCVQRGKIIVKERRGIPMIKVPRRTHSFQSRSGVRVGRAQFVCSGDSVLTAKQWVQLDWCFLYSPPPPPVRPNETVQATCARCPVFVCFSYFTFLYQLLRLCGSKGYGSLLWMIMNQGDCERKGYDT